MLIQRRAEAEVVDRLGQSPAVALIGPRQVGKTTLALELASTRPSVYLDLESETDRAKLSEPELYLASHADELVILDEVHRAPGLFQILRGLIDSGRRRGRRAGRFLLLGSASIDLLKQSGETLAGRIAFVELDPFDVLEVGAPRASDLWLRGGFPESFLAANDAQSLRWRQDFIRTYLERDIPLLGPRVSAETLRRFWTMIAHAQASVLNTAALARGLGVDGKTVARYLDLLVDLLLVRRLAPWHRNVGKRLVKSPKVFIRDSGLAHALLGIRDMEALVGHPVVGPSWEAYAIENVLTVAPRAVEASFFRTAAGAEVDLVLTWPDETTWAIEMKRGLNPSVERGFHSARETLSPERSFVVYPGTERFPLATDVEAIGLPELLALVGARR